ncbi:hypothetical protein TBS_06560 [Thermobispora bispora]|uniref:metallophosphoesterase family protein n=1 Tax=Thermobispora bispora TaxID=2006 RepID=UPI0030E7BE5B
MLAEPDVRAADRIVVTGDIAAGPQPVEVLGPLTELGDRVIRVRGNADRGMVEFLRTGHLATPGRDRGLAARRLRPEQVALLGGLPESVTLEVGDLAPVLFCHATPRNDEEVVLVDSRLDRWAEVHAGLDPAVGTVVRGHTHMPFARLAHGRLVVNPGGVGMPYGRPGAHWALLGSGVDAAADHVRHRRRVRPDRGGVGVSGGGGLARLLRPRPGHRRRGPRGLRAAGRAVVTRPARGTAPGNRITGMRTARR